MVACTSLLTSAVPLTTDMLVYYTIVNLIDECIYDGTPLFSSRKEACLWFHKNDGRPSSVVVKVTIKDDKNSCQ